MITTMPNDRTVNAKVTRGELCRLIILLRCVTSDKYGEKWIDLHNKLKTQLEEFDKKQEGKE